MHYYVLTLFPEMITNACGESILGRASQKGLISVEAINIRDYSTNKHNRVDDYPYGGGAGMVMQPMPVYDAWKDLTERIGKKPRVLFMTPQGKPFSQKLAEEYAKENNIKINFIKIDSLEKAKNAPCIFNNWANFYKGKFISNTILNANSFKKLID